MPFLDLKLDRPVSQTTRQRIAAALTGLTADLLGKRADLTAIAIESLPPGHWFIGGEATEERATFRLEVKITAGSNSDGEKSRYLAAVFAALEDILGPLAAASYIVVHDVDAEAWGYGGRTQAERRRDAGTMTYA